MTRTSSILMHLAYLGSTVELVCALVHMMNTVHFSSVFVPFYQFIVHSSDILGQSACSGWQLSSLYINTLYTCVHILSLINSTMVSMFACVLKDMVSNVSPGTKPPTGIMLWFLAVGLNVTVMHIMQHMLKRVYNHIESREGTILNI